MNNPFLQFMPIFILLGIPIIFIVVIKMKVSNDRNGDPFQVNHGYRTLCKSENNRIFAGVCGGIAEYFGWNATVVRLVFLLAGVSLLAYIILAVVLPDSQSPLI